VDRVSFGVLCAQDVVVITPSRTTRITNNVFRILPYYSYVQL
jgi:hypothetical protein